MTANEIYKLPVKETTKELWQLKGYSSDLLPEIDEYELHVIEKLNTLIDIRTFVEVILDEQQQYWKLAGVFFNDKPVMVIQRAGKMGDGHTARFITDETLFTQMIEYIISLCTPVEEEKLDIINPDEDIPALTEFFYHKISELYQPDFKPRFKVGNIITVKSKEPCDGIKGFISTDILVKVLAVTDSPYGTYFTKRVRYEQNTNPTPDDYGDTVARIWGPYMRFNNDLTIVY